VKGQVERALIAWLVVGCVGCATQQRNIHSSSVEYLYSGGFDGTAATVVKLQAPVRVGIGFAPTAAVGDAFSEEKKQELLKRIADAFRAEPKIGSIEIIPSTYLNPRGGFAELDRLRVALRVNEIVLISYDQVQFSDTGAMGLTYWAYGVPAYVIKGEKNETRTFLDAVVLDIPTRTMLFHASGQSSIKGSSTLVGVGTALRERSAAGFDEAVKVLIPNLDTQLKAFEASVKNGEIAVEATPKLPAWNPTAPGAPIQASPGPVTTNSSGQSGATDATFGLALLVLVAMFEVARSSARVGRRARTDFSNADAE
jgi:rhombotail lipoprotein